MSTAIGFHDIPLAVIGLGCRMPGAANLDEYWQQIVEGRSAITQLPEYRLNRELHFDPRKGVLGKSYSEIGGYVPDHPFDRDSLPLPDVMYDNYDVAHLTMCDVAAQACRHAGMDPFNLPSRNTGVYIGHSGGSPLAGDIAYSTYVEEMARVLRESEGFDRLPEDTREATIRDIVGQVRRELPHRMPNGGPELAANAVAGVVSRAFQLHGPFLAVDAACASSLIALAIGAHALQLGQIDMAIVGGASYSKWFGLVIFSQAQSMSSTGSRPFDAGADGLISSDGYAAVVLKTLPKALADGDEIHSVIRGVGISSDGRGKSLWAPRKEGQIKAIHRAYGNCLDPARLQYIECHATSTQVGDATELGALSTALRDRIPAGHKIPIGSVKANIGHTLESAGIAGFVKAVMAMKHRTLPPQINFKTPNEEIDWTQLPFYVNTERKPWDEPADGRPRRTAVNAFGIGGLNVHVVLDDRPDDPAKAAVSVSVPLGDYVRVKRDDRVAIVGMGAILPGALTIDAYWDLLVSGRDPKMDVPAGRWTPEIYHDPNSDGLWRAKTKFGGFIDDFVYDWKKHRVPPKQIANANPLQFMLLDAADQALRDAGFDQRPLNRERASVVVGTIFGGDFACQMQMGLRLPEFQKRIRDTLLAKGVPTEQIDAVAEGFQKSLLSQMPALLDETGSFTSSTLASRLSKTFDLMGGALAIDGGDTSSMAALSAGIGLLMTGSSDVVMCAAGQRSMDVTVYEAFGVRGWLSKGHPTAPYDAENDGFVPGEGVGVLLLKRLSDAERDGDKIHGVIRGVGVSTYTEDYEAAIGESAERALADSGLKASQIEVIETARASFGELDRAEVAALNGAYRSTADRPIPTRSVIGQLGHLLGTSGMAAMIKGVLELNHGTVPGMHGLNSPIAEATAPGSLLDVSSQSVKAHSSIGGGKAIAAIENLSYTGTSFHVLLEAGNNLPARPVPAAAVTGDAAADWRVVRVSAAQSKFIPQKLAVTSEGALFEHGSQRHFNNQDRARLAIVAADPSAVGQKLKLLAQHHDKPAGRTYLEQHGVFAWDLDERTAKVAFVFPGQGSQYADMLGSIIAASPAAVAFVDEANDALAAVGLPTLEAIFANKGDALGKDVLLTQVSMLLGDLLMFRVVREMGIEPDVVCGHSYGEFAALTAAGVLDLRTALQATKLRTDAVEAHVDGSFKMASTNAPRELVERVISQMTGAVAVSSHNAPDQTVIAGTTDAVAGVCRLLEGENHATRVLAVPRPYHTPLMEAARGPFAAALQGLTLQTPSLTFVSGVSNRAETDPARIAKNLADQLSQTVEYVDLIRSLAADGVNVFIEIGPSQVLTRLNQRILADTDVTCLATDQPKRSGREQICRVQALAECADLINRQPPTPPLKQVAPAMSSERLDLPSPSRPRQQRGSGKVSHHDATQRRKDKRRRQATGASVPAPALAASTNAASTHAVERATVTPAPAPAPAAAVAETRPAVAPQKAEAGIAQVALAAAATKTEPSPSEPTRSVDRAELEKFVVEFVIDQTGYPEELVELDADLEADLGIDSIKKAQLFGELAEKFDLKHLASEVANLSLDDFPTLRAMVDFLATPRSEEAAGSAPVAAAPLTEAPAPAPAPATATATPQTSETTAVDRAELEKFVVEFVIDQTGYPEELVELDADLEADLGIDSIKKAQLFGELAEKFDLKHLASEVANLSLDDFPTLRAMVDFLATPRSEEAAGPAPVAAAPVAVTPVAAAPVTNPPAPAPAQAAVTATPQTSETTTVDRAELEKFVVEFVIDQTGYPEELVELDADLEADLGIDSIKKAQLFGELAEKFDLKHLASEVANLSLDDFPTLRAMVDFLATPRSSEASASNPVAAPEATPPVPAAEETSPPPAPPAPPARNGSPVMNGSAAEEKFEHAKPANGAVDDNAGGSVARAELEKFVVEFVIDQTGYPEELVELDADLEADLGIDSIKKAQLFGELAEKFDLKHLASEVANLSLDDFPTLRHIVEFLAQPQEVSLPVGESVAERRATAPAAQPAAAGMTSHESAANDALKLVALSGDSATMGLAHGQSQGAAIRTILERHAALLGPRLQNIPELDEALADPLMYFSDDELAELRGIAEGADLPFEVIVAHNLGMYPEYIPGCTQFAVAARANGHLGLIHGVNEDSPLALSLPDCLERIVQIRRPAGKLAHLTFSIAGQVGGLNGINSKGLAVSSTLLLDRPRRQSTAIGKIHPVIVKKVLESAATIEDALEILHQYDRAGAWSLCISHHPTDQICYVEYDGTSLKVRRENEQVMTTNHCLLHDPIRSVPEHSKHRLTRLQQMLGEADASGLTRELAQTTLRDRYDLGRGRKTTHATMNTIRRVDNQISVVMLPAAGEVWVTPGPRGNGHVDDFYRLNVSELLGTGTVNGTAHRNGQAAPVKPSVPAAKPAKPAAPAMSDPREGLPPEGDRVMRRYVLRTIEQPLAENLPAWQPSGAILVVGNNTAAQALVEMLTPCGQPVHHLTGDEGYEAVVAEIDRLFDAAPLYHLFLTGGRDKASSSLAADVQFPFWVCQRWVKRLSDLKPTEPASLLAVTALGGDFGCRGNIGNVGGGGIAGLLKGIRREFDPLVVKVLDTAAGESPAAVAEAALRELVAGDGKVEVGLIRGKRHVVHSVPQPASQLPPVQVPSGTNWVITGGARGVTAVVARELGRRLGAKLHLIGSSPRPEIDPSWRNLTEEGMKSLRQSVMRQAREQGKTPVNEWKRVEKAIDLDRSLQTFTNAGVDFTYHVCDVADREALRSVLDTVRTGGSIDGVIHGAGIEAACRFDRKKPENVAATIDIKVGGAENLIELTANDPLRYFIGFGSTSGRFGGLGQADYSAASDLLCKICADLRAKRPDVAAIGVHWPPWDEVGMAARPESRLALQASDLKFMPPLEGAAFLLEEILTGGTEAEVTFVDGPGVLDLDRTMPAEADTDAYFLKAPRVANSPFMDTIHNLQPGSTVSTRVSFDPKKEPFLLEHRHLSIPILPVVVGLECCGEAATLAARAEQIAGFRNVDVVNGLRFHTDRSQTATVDVRASENPQEFTAELAADFRDRHGRLVEPDKSYLSTTVLVGPRFVEKPQLGAAPTEWEAVKYPTDWRTMKFPEDGRVFHGAPLRAFQQMSVVEDGLWGKLVVPPVEELAGGRPVAGWLTPSATLDACLVATDHYLWRTFRTAQLPRAFGEVRFGRQPKAGESLTLRVWMKERKDRLMTVDFTLVADSDGAMIIDCKAHSMVEVKTGTGGGSHAAADPAAEPSAPSQAAAATTPAPVTVGPLGELPLIDRVDSRDAGHWSAVMNLDPTQDPFLLQHNYEGKPLLPAVVGIEAMLESAYALAGDQQITGIRDVRIPSGFRFRENVARAAKIELDATKNGFKCRLIDDAANGKICQSGIVELADAAPVLDAAPMGDPPFPQNPMMYPEEAVLVHGPVFRCLKELFLHRDGGWCRVTARAPDELGGSRAGKRWLLPAAVLDSCLVACGVYSFILTSKRVEIPQGFEQIRIGRQARLNEKCRLRLFFREQDEKGSTYDFTLVGDDGAVIVDVRGYRSMLVG